MHRLTTRQLGPRRPGRPNQIRGEQHPNAKLTEELVRRIRRLHAEGVGSVTISRMLQIRESAVKRVLTLQSWAWLT